MTRKRLKPFTELGDFSLDPTSIHMLPFAFCARQQVAVLGEVVLGAPEPIHLGMTDTSDTDLLSALSLRWARPVIAVQLTSFEIQRVLDIGFGSEGGPDAYAGHVLPADLPQAQPDDDAARQLDCTLLHAIQKRASDIHIERYRRDVDVRIRVDGVLIQHQTHITPDNINGVINRIKILTSLDIAESRVSQDGGFRMSVVDGDRVSALDCRASILPGPHGEDAVLRILDPQVGLVDLGRLGMTPEMAATFEGLLANPEGTVLVTGPTGSGKSTTLYAALDKLNDGRRKILTAEDPIEYTLDKVNQKQVSPVMSMSDLARAFLRHDPDIILIGEVRDRETAATAAKAACTGHLVLGTLHTSDALGSIPRLRGLELSDDQISDSLLAILAQRLARRVCQYCAETWPITETQRAKLSTLLDSWDGETLHAKGCDRCNGIGYSGRIGLFELLVFDHTMISAIADGMHAPGLRALLRQKGHPSLVDDALEKVQDGLTTLDELLRVVPVRQIRAEIDSRTMTTD